MSGAPWPLAAALLGGASLGAATLLAGRPAARARLVRRSPTIAPSAGALGASVRGRLAARARRLSGPDVPAALAAASSLAAELAALLRAGLGPVDAWHHAATAAGSVVGPRPEALAVSVAARSAALAARAGGDVGQALRGAAPRGEVPAPLARLAAAWDVAARTGAPTADVLDALARGLAAERDEVLGLRAALAGPRASAVVLALLPLAGVGLGLLMGVNPVGVLVGTTVGRVCALAGLGLGAGGWWWTSRMVAAAARVR